MKDESQRQLVQSLGKNLPKQKYEWCFIKSNKTDERQGSRAIRSSRRSSNDTASRRSSDPPAADPEEYPERWSTTATSTTTTSRSTRTNRASLCHNIVPAGIDFSGTGTSLGGNVTTGAAERGRPDGHRQGDHPQRRHAAGASTRTGPFFIATAIITVFLAMVASYVIVRYVIVKPLRHLRDVSDAISRGNTTLRAEIHTGDEFEELAVAFNRMLRHLTAAQEELRQANVSLDGKVDELAQANMRLYELNMLKSDFLATMSHELRTPLNSILGFSEVLGSIDALDEKQKRYVQNIQKSGKTLLEMINDILDLAKIESGKMETRLTRLPHRAGGRRAVRHGPAADGAEEHRPGKPRRRRVAADAPGPGPRAADPQQSALQRHQVHARRGPHRGDGRAATRRTSWCSR